MKRIIAFILCLLLLSAPALALELFGYMDQPIEAMQKVVELDKGDVVIIGGDDMTGREYTSRRIGLTVSVSDYTDTIFSIDISSGGGEYSLAGISLGQTPGQALAGANAYANANHCSFEGYQYNDGISVDIDLAIIDAIVDNGIVTSIYCYYL